MINYIWAAALGLCALQVSAQPPSLTITTSKTTSVVFPAAVRHVDRGSRDVLVQPVPGADHVLLVRAARQDFAPTNLSVVTADGRVYALGVVYDPEPARWIYTLRDEHDVSPEQYARALLDNPRTVHGISGRAPGMSAWVKGLYLRGQVLYVQLEVANTGPLDFHTEPLRFYLQPSGGGQRAARQQTELSARVVGEVARIAAYSRTTLVAVLPHFTLPEGHRLSMELLEKDGGRRLQLHLRGARLLKARPLPELR